MTESKDGPRWGHKWGFADTEFVLHDDNSVELTGSRYDLCGTRLPDFMPYVEEMVGATIDPKDRLEERGDKPVAPARDTAAFQLALGNALKPDQVTADDPVRLLHSHGQTTTDEVFSVLYSELPRFVDLVVYPTSHEEVVAIVEAAEREGVCLVPYGGGTSVSSALVVPEAEERPVVSVDLTRMNRVVSIDRGNGLAVVEAGIRGSDLEARLAESGLTCGHEPDSIELSTLGGWIATNASGMKRNRYGNIEDIVVAFTVVTPTGVVEELAATARSAFGMQPKALLFGSEGNLGIITRATLKVHKKPEVTEYGALVFRNMTAGIDYLRELRTGGTLPACIRLVDNVQFRFGHALRGGSKGAVAAFVDRAKKAYLVNVLGFKTDELVAATMVFEGAAAEVELQKRAVFQLAKRHGAVAGGAEAGQRGFMLTYAIAYIRDFLAAYHVIGETFETTVPWDKIEDVAAAVRATAKDKHTEHGLPGKPYVSYRITQLYHSGVCCYFMYGIYAKGVPLPEKVFGSIEKSLRQAILDHGGSISHHHGVGKLRQQFMPQVLSDGSIKMLRAIKQAVDPNNVFGIRNNVFDDLDAVDANGGGEAQS